MNVQQLYTMPAARRSPLRLNNRIDNPIAPFRPPSAGKKTVLSWVTARPRKREAAGEIG